MEKYCIPSKIDNEYATYEFHAEAIVGEEEDMMDDGIDGGGEDDEDEDYDPRKDYIKVRESFTW